jgi:hypothetical protein
MRRGIMLDWRPVDSTRITHEAYDEASETIFVRFPEGVEWCYEACPPAVWEEFTSQSRGEYISKVLNDKPHHRFSEG